MTAKTPRGGLGEELSAAELSAALPSDFFVDAGATEQRRGLERKRGRTAKQRQGRKPKASRRSRSITFRATAETAALLERLMQHETMESGKKASMADVLELAVHALAGQRKVRDDP